MADSENTKFYQKSQYEQSPSRKDSLSTTEQLSRSNVLNKIPIKQEASLEIVRNGEEKEIIKLGELEVLIGRDPSCNLRFISKNVSRKHARIFFCNDEHYVEDLGSTNGTYVNGIRVVKCALRKNDLIYIGEITILFNE
jgi:pSer/pThr/pTyr-binding forkhead associated (FHA) protein